MLPCFTCAAGERPFSAVAHAEPSADSARPPTSDVLKQDEAEVDETSTAYGQDNLSRLYGVDTAGRIAFR
ncbi:MAG: hypothetical protein ACRECI_13735 [Methyloceanibacter sp.]